MNTDDIKELRQSIREILAEVRGLASSVHSLEIEQARRFAGIEARMDQRDGVTRWVATAIAPSIIALMGFIVAGGRGTRGG